MLRFSLYCQPKYCYKAKSNNNPRLLPKLTFQKAAITHHAIVKQADRWSTIDDNRRAFMRPIHGIQAPSEPMPAFSPQNGAIQLRRRGLFIYYSKAPRWHSNAHLCTHTRCASGPLEPCAPESEFANRIRETRDNARSDVNAVMSRDGALSARIYSTEFDVWVYWLIR